MKSIPLLLIVLLLIGSSCKTSQTSTKQTPSKRTLPEVVYSIKEEEGYKLIELAKEQRPEPIQGKDQWVRDFYTTMKYPAKARQNSVQGIVILDVIIDENGKVLSVDVGHGLSAECDTEAKRAFLQSTQEGYQPLIFNGEPVKFKMEVPVGFWLQ